MAMSEREQLPPVEQEAERFTALGQIAGELIHDLANVVAVVHGRAALALGDAREGRPPTAELERLVEASEDLGMMLRDVLEILRGSQLSREVSFDPVRVIERTIRRFLDSAPAIEIRLISSLPPQTLVPGRASFLARSVLNLLHNAARYARSEIRLTLSLTEERVPELLLLVEDDGPGLAPALLANLFQPLVRGEGGGVAGLGLSSVSWAVRQLGGEVRYRSDALLGGAAFEVRLPVTLERREPAAARVDALVGTRLVLMDDDAGVQVALCRLLSRLGAEITAFDPSGQADEDILKALLGAMPDVVLLDLRLGTRAGGELWYALERLLPALARRVVFLSALGPGDPEWELAQRTGQPVLAKPLDAGELARVIVDLLPESNPT